MTFHELFSTFNERLGVNTDPNDDGVYTFEIDTLTFTVFDLSQADQVAFAGDLGEIPSGQETEGLYRLLLEAQYLFRETQGAAFAIDPETGHLTLCRTLPLNALNKDIFFAQAEHFVNCLETWSEIIRNYRSAVPGKIPGGELPIETAFPGTGMILV